MPTQAFPTGNDTDARDQLAPLTPQISLISSWLVPGWSGETDDVTRRLPGGLEIAAEEGVRDFDLYYLDHSEVAWYVACAGRVKRTGPAQPNGPAGARRRKPRDPQSVAAWLAQDRSRLDRVALRLTQGLIGKAEQRLVGPPPRYAALATYFPDASNTKNEAQRQKAVDALRSAVYLAWFLGCRCVEVVGGPRLTDDPIQGFRKLAETVCAVYGDRPEGSLLGDIRIGDLPALAFEIEPGPGFLLRSLEDVVALRTECRLTCSQVGPGWRELQAKCLLNIDVAHMFLIGQRAEDLDPEVEPLIAHMHISDHGGDRQGGGEHSSDLLVGSFHPIDFYWPWLTLAAKLTSAAVRNGRSRFSGYIAVEMEARNSIHDVLGALHTVRRWARMATAAWAKTDPDAVADTGTARWNAGKHEGAILVIDLGNSTRRLLSRGAGSEPDEGSLRMEQVVGALCRVVADRCGTVLSYTGDGLIALFDSNSFASDEHAVRAARAAVQKASTTTQKLLRQAEGRQAVGSVAGVGGRKSRPNEPVSEPNVTLRAALHWGAVYVPVSGALHGQAIGRDVVLAARLCDWLARSVEETYPPEEREAVVGCTAAFLTLLQGKDKLSQNEREQDTPQQWFWVNLGLREFKGLPDRSRIFRRQEAWETSTERGGVDRLWKA